MINFKKFVLHSFFILILLNLTINCAYCSENSDDSYPMFKKTDSSTGISVLAPSGIYPKNAELKVTELEINSAEYEKAVSGLDSDKAKNVQKLNIYNIEVLENGKNIELKENQTVVVRIPIPYSFDKNDIEALNIVYGDNNDIKISGTVTEIDGKPYFEFSTNKLNQFKNITIIDTKNIFTTILVLTLTIAVIIILIILYQKNKRKQQITSV